MGKCSNCGHVQPGLPHGNTVEILAEGGCAKCGGFTFLAVEDEADLPTVEVDQKSFRPSSKEA